MKIPLNPMKSAKMLAMWSMTPLDKEFNGKWTHALPCVPLSLKGRDFTPTLTC